MGKFRIRNESFSISDKDYIKRRLESGKIIYPNECWGYLSNDINAHTHLMIDNISYGLHVIAGYAYLNHNLNDKLMTLHKCGNGGCWNPEHLYKGDESQNMKDCIEHGKFPPSTKTHCKNGHEFTPGSFRMRRGWRECLRCTREYTQRRLARRRK